MRVRGHPHRSHLQCVFIKMIGPIFFGPFQTPNLDKVPAGIERRLAIDRSSKSHFHAPRPGMQPAGHVSRPSGVADAVEATRLLLGPRIFGKQSLFQALCRSR